MDPAQGGPLKQGPPYDLISQRALKQFSVLSSQFSVSRTTVGVRHRPAKVKVHNASSSLWTRDPGCAHNAFRARASSGSEPGGLAWHACKFYLDSATNAVGRSRPARELAQQRHAGDASRTASRVWPPSRADGRRLCRARSSKPTSGGPRFRNSCRPAPTAGWSSRYWTALTLGRAWQTVTAGLTHHRSAGRTIAANDA